MTTWTGRGPPNFSRTLYNSHTLYDSHLRWDGVIINQPVYTDRTIPTTSWGARTPVVNSQVMPVLYGGIWNDSLLWDDTLLWLDDSVAGSSWSGRTIP